MIEQAFNAAQQIVADHLHISIFRPRGGTNSARRSMRLQKISRDFASCSPSRAFSMSLNRPVPIDRSYDTSLFDCGLEPLNEYLRKYALMNHQNRSARTYVAMRESRLAGYYTLAAGSVSRDEVPQRVALGLGQYPVPITLLARLAVDTSEKGKGLGRSLLKDGILRAFQASELVGSRAVVTHAKDAAAKAFYEKFDFVASPIHELNLYLPMKDVRLIVDRP